MGNKVLGKQCDFVSQINFLQYGCWCGPSKSSDLPPPVDEFDRACMDHDRCYDSLERSKKCKKGSWPADLLTDLYKKHYKWTYQYHKRIDTFTITCRDKKEKKCARGLCECDKKLVLGLARLSFLRGCRKESAQCRRNGY